MSDSDSTTPLVDTVTLLRGQSLACKRVTPEGVTPAAKETWFQAQAVPVGNLVELSDVLAMVVQDSCMFVVRGTPRGDRDTIRRTHLGPEACLDDRPHHWLALDLDSVRPELKPEEFAQDPGLWAAWARAQLPEAWAQAACWWQATGSAGIKPGLRLRLVFWMQRALSSREAKLLAKSLPLAVDTGLYTPSQPHYTSRPVFEGLADPVTGPREGMLPGLPEVTIQDQDEPALGLACTRVARAPEGERRTTLNTQAFMLARTTDLPDTRILEALVKAACMNQWTELEARQVTGVAVRDGRAKRLADMDGWRADLARDKSGEPSVTYGNVVLYVLHQQALAGRIGLDGTRLLWVKAPPWDQEPRPWRDADAQELLLWFQTQAGLSVPNPGWCEGAAWLAGSRNQVCEVQDYLSALPEWDGTDRVDTFFIRHWGVEDSSLNRAQSRIWFAQAARRAWASLDSPVTAQYLIVLQGPGGLRKSLGLRALCKRQAWFRDLVPDLRDKDSSLAMLDSWIVELAELTHKRADQDVVKAFLTRSVEKFRPHYGRATILAPRRCALIGTCNEPTFLSDPTGNRRYWPMTCTRRADLGEIEAERDQLWAEAQARREEQAWLPDPMELDAALVQDQHRDPAPEELVQERVVQALSERGFAPDMSLITQAEVHEDRLVLVSYRLVCALAGLDPLKSGPLVGRALGGLGWPRRRIKLRSGSFQSTVNRWVLPEGLRPVLRVPGRAQAQA